MNKIKYYPRNPNGRDIVVGDIHGCYNELMAGLEAIGFEKRLDHLYAVGDLIDRGPKSFECAQLIYEDWFRSVLGNHEHMMIQTLLYDDYEMRSIWKNNGGMWQFDYEQYKLKDLAQDLKECPLVIVVGEDEERFHVVHAEIFHQEIVNQYPERVPVTDQMIDHWPFNKWEMEEMMWGRMIYEGTRGLPEYGDRPRFHSPDMSLTFVGHTPLALPYQVDRQMYIDTSAVYHYWKSPYYETNSLTFAEPYEKMLYIYSLSEKRVQRLPFEQIGKRCV
jgi:serine/threonine protein phosphatase 1